MRKLYCKIFIWFWLTMLLTIVATVFVTAQFSHQTHDQQRDNNFIKTVSSAALLMLNSGEQQQFEQWVEYLQHYEGVELFLLHNHRWHPNLRQRIAVDPQLQHVLYQLKLRPLPKKIIHIDPYIISAPFLTNAGNSYRIIAKMPPRYELFIRRHWHGLVIRLLIAIIVSAGICYLLSRYLSKPLDVLKKASRKLAEGHLETRVGDRLPKRRDELGDLVAEFDNMAEQIQDLIQSRQRLLGDISHELRSPLARLFVAVELARDRGNGENHAELARIELEANRLNELISLILTLASLEMESMQLPPSIFNLSELVDNVVADANFEIQQDTKQVVLRVDTPVFIKGHHHLVASAIENCIRNAIRYAPANTGIEVAVSVKDKWAVVVICDHGPGIPEHQITHIFEPFYRVDGSRTMKSGGYGLGLAITKKAIKLHHGYIDAKNILPNGLQITIKLPLHLS